MATERFLVCLRTAAEDGLLLAVKYGLILAVLGWVLLDYVNVRQAAYYAATAVQQAQQAPGK